MNLQKQISVCWRRPWRKIKAEGIPCYFVNRSVPTPLVMYYVMMHDYPYGMMVTASHNPALYNGVKVFTADGRDADGNQTREIEEYIAHVNPDGIHKIEYDEAVKQGLVHEFYPMNEYVDDIMVEIDIAAIKRYCRKNLVPAIWRKRVYRFSEQLKAELMKRLYEDQELPSLEPYPVERISYMDGCKVYFANEGWLSIRFSGTEPLLRIFCEMPMAEVAEEFCGKVENFFGL